MLEFEEIEGEFENAGELAVWLLFELEGCESAVLSLEFVFLFFSLERPTSQFKLCRLLSNPIPCVPFGVSFGVSFGVLLDCSSIMA